MIPLTLEEVAAACGGRLEAGDPRAVATGVAIDSRTTAPGDLFVALRGAIVRRRRLRRRRARRRRGRRRRRAADGVGHAGRHAAHRGRRRPARAGRPRRRGAPPLRSRRSWPSPAASARPRPRTSSRPCWRPWRGSWPRAATTTTRSACRSPCSRSSRPPRCSSASLPCAGRGQIAELAAIVKPDVGVITNIAPVHLELVGTIEEVAAAKAEIIAELGKGALVVPADEALLEPHLRYHTGRLVTFGGEGANVCVAEAAGRAASRRTP